MCLGLHVCVRPCGARAERGRAEQAPLIEFSALCCAPSPRCASKSASLTPTAQQTSWVSREMRGGGGDGGELWWMDDGSDRRAGVASCAVRASLARERRWGLLMSENYAQTERPTSGHRAGVAAAGRGAPPHQRPPRLCGQFLNAVQFREPMARLMSHFRHLFAVGTRKARPSKARGSRGQIVGLKPTWLPQELGVRLPCSVAEMAACAAAGARVRPRQASGGWGWRGGGWGWWVGACDPDASACTAYA